MIKKNNSYKTATKPFKEQHKMDKDMIANWFK